MREGEKESISVCDFNYFLPVYLKIGYKIFGFLQVTFIGVQISSVQLKTKHRLHAALCTHHPKRSLFPSPFPSFAHFHLLPIPFPSGYHHMLSVSMCYVCFFA